MGRPAGRTIGQRLESLRYAYLRRGVSTVVGALGPARAARLATLLARGVYDLNPPGRRVAEARLATAFGAGLSDATRDAIVRTMYEHIGRFWVEAVFLSRRLRERSWRRFVTIDSALPVERLVADHPRVIAATAYFGNPGVAAYALGQLFRPVHVVVDLLADPAARAWQERLYRMGQVCPVTVERAARELPERLSRAGAVMLVAEHRRRRGGGVAAPFLGESGLYQPTAGLLAEWCGVPVVPVLCRRRPGPFAFEVWLGRPVRAADAAATTAEMLAQLEGQIRRWPEQYLWSIPADGPGVAGDSRGVSAG
ncbi:MAG: hypothetical protein U1A27_11830 [Phycisphaerae bacterium]